MADSMSTLTTTQRHGERTRGELLDAAARLIERGEQPTMRAVAAEARVGERTIYRHFESREALHDAVTAHIGPRLGIPLCDSIDELGDYADGLFSVFEENRALTVAMVTAAWSQPDLALTRNANLKAITELLRSAFPRTRAAEIDSAAASLRTVLSGAGWVYQRVSCGLPQDAVVANARWLIDRVLAALRA
jgi:AcrR family transcriptional regulator